MIQQNPKTPYSNPLVTILKWNRRLQKPVRHSSIFGEKLLGSHHPKWYDALCFGKVPGMEEGCGETATSRRTVVKGVEERPKQAVSEANALALKSTNRTPLSRPHCTPVQGHLNWQETSGRVLNAR